MEARTTLCNLSIEGGACFGMIVPRRHHVRLFSRPPPRPQSHRHLGHPPSELDAPFDKEVALNAAEVAPSSPGHLPRRCPPSHGQHPRSGQSGPQSRPRAGRARLYGPHPRPPLPRRERHLTPGWTTHQGQAIALDRENVDTDLLIPARFMVASRSEGYGRYLLNDLR